MKAQKFRVIIDDRNRITIPISNIKVLDKEFHKEKRDWPGSVIEMEIKTIRFRDGTKVDFETIK